MKKNLQNLFLGMVAFILVLSIVVLLQSRLPWGPLHNLIILLPIFPVIYIGLTIGRAVGDMDELQRRIQLEAIAFSLANTVLITFALGLLQVASLEFINLMWVLPIASLFWAVGLFIAHRRYQ
jgi:hypothetical protein